MYRLSKKKGKINSTVNLPVSKSVFNRVAVIKFMCGSSLQLEDDLPEDCKIILRSLASKSSQINIGHSGTAMRFLTAYLCTLDKETIITGSDRMHQRPIGPLVDALISLGADIQYIDKHGYPPLKIKGGKLKGGQIKISGSVSSQFITALLLISTKMENGLAIELIPPIVSKPYIEMTMEIMRAFGLEMEFKDNLINVPQQAYIDVDFSIEKDWSAAAFWFEWVALNVDSEILLKGLKLNSCQGDKAAADVFGLLGVQISEEKEGIRLTNKKTITSKLNLDCTSFPDMVQSIAITCAGLGIDCALTGLETLQIKETKRITALSNELGKIGIHTDETDSTLKFSNVSVNRTTATFQTYDDHRMAMALAPLCSVISEVYIDDPEVVIKSYPTFWDELVKFCLIEQK